MAYASRNHSAVEHHSGASVSVRPGNIFQTSDKPRVAIAPCAPHVRQHAIVLFSEGDRVIRQRALDELKRLAVEADDNGAQEVLLQFDEWKKSRP
jgi:hypothetical protein